MAHHIGDFEVSSTWAAICNELCCRVSLFPDHFDFPAAMLPQSPGAWTRRPFIPELVKCVEQYGNVGINLNPDPGSGHWTTPLTDATGTPSTRKMVEYDIPAIHVDDRACSPTPARTTSTRHHPR